LQPRDDSARWERDGDDRARRACPLPGSLFQSGFLPGQGRLAGPGYSPQAKAVFAWSVLTFGRRAASPDRIMGHSPARAEQNRHGDPNHHVARDCLHKAGALMAKEADGRESGRRRGRLWDGSAAMRAGVARPRTGTGAHSIPWERTEQDPKRRKSGGAAPGFDPKRGVARDMLAFFVPRRTLRGPPRRPNS
jgi:hypothetical protein